MLELLRHRKSLSRMSLHTKLVLAVNGALLVGGSLAVFLLEGRNPACLLYTSIVESCRMLCQKYGGQVPGDMDALQTLPGVGRKTANVVLANAFGVPTIAVDTHVFRVSNRLGLADANTVEKTEEQLMKAIPKQDWVAAHHWLIFHGRRVCHARNPECERCTLREYCKAYHEGDTTGPKQKQAARKSLNA